MGAPDRIGDYEILGELGRGAMGVVYRARRPSMPEREVALKEIPLLAGERDRARKLREARALLLVKSVHVVALHDVFEIAERSSLCLAMERLKSETLRDRLTVLGTGLDLDATIEILDAVLDALEAAHSAEDASGRRTPIVHRDLKPENIGFLDWRGRELVKVMDFGVARIVEQEGEARTTVQAFTPAYAAPEVLLGQRAEPPADLFSVGILAWELLVGRHPFADARGHLPPSLALQTRLAREPIPPLPQTLQQRMPEAIIDLVRDLSALDPRLRPTATEARERVARMRRPSKPSALRSPAAEARRAVEVPPGRPVPPTPVERFSAQVAGFVRWFRQLPRRLQIVAGGGVVAAFLLGGLAGIDTSQPPATTGPGAPVPPTFVPSPTTPQRSPSPTTGTFTSAPVGSLAPTFVAEGMIGIPASAFNMGSATGDDDESPVHTVSLAAFAIDRTEVTVADYDACVARGLCAAPTRSCSNNTSRRNQPVICVNWFDANEFCRQQGKRLPTEAEWEFAARGTDGRTFPWGNEPPDCDRADFAATGLTTGSCAGQGTGLADSHPTGASPFGVLNMAGNVWEWVADLYGPYGAARVVAPLGPAAGELQVVRGGTWGSPERELRTTERRALFPQAEQPGVGFRCATSADASTRGGGGTARPEVDLGGARGARDVAPAPAGLSPARRGPTRAEILAAMNSVEADVRACTLGVSGTAMMSITFFRLGGVLTSRVISGFSGPTASCIEIAVNTARAPPFDGPDVTVRFPFVIR